MLEGVLVLALQKRLALGFTLGWGCVIPNVRIMVKGRVSVRVSANFRIIERIRVRVDKVTQKAVLELQGALK